MISELENEIKNKNWTLLLSDSQLTDTLSLNPSIPFVVNAFKNYELTNDDKYYLLVFATQLNIKELPELLFLGVHDSAPVVVSAYSEMLLKKQIDISKALDADFLLERIAYFSKGHENSDVVSPLIRLLGTLNDRKALDNAEKLINTCFSKNTQGTELFNVFDDLFLARARTQDPLAVKIVYEKLADTNDCVTLHMLDNLLYVNDKQYIPEVAKHLTNQHTYPSVNDIELRLISDHVITCLSKLDTSLSSNVAVIFDNDKIYNLGDHIQVRKYYKIPTKDLEETIPKEELHKYGLIYSPDEQEME